MILLGLTGDIAAGKSTVARLLEKRGAAVIDSDTLVHELYADREFASHVVALFGDEKLQTPEGAINRAVLGARVFEDARALRQLELLVHPAVAALREKKLTALREQAEPPPVAVLEAVKLVESGQHIGCDCVWWIRAQPETQLARLMHDRALPEDAAKARLANQPDPIAKCKLLGTVPLVVIYNDRSLEDLEVNVAAAWETLF
ncbi:MAG TPA: dephospho-CoA kinase [Abditibacteriaceae bacterium]